METKFIIVQILGGLVFILNVVGSSKISTGKVYWYNGVCNFISILQYVLLGAWSGVICCLVAILRNIVFSLYKKDVPFMALIIYILIAVSLNVFTGSIKTWIDILPIINIIVFAIALWGKRIMSIKIAGTFTCVTGVVYDFNKQAYVSVLNQVVDGVIGGICIYKLVKDSKKKKKTRKSKSKRRTK